MRLFRFSAVLMLLLVAVDTAAQTVSGSMSGVIVDGTGQVLPGADVAIIHENSGEERRTVTNEIGAFVFPSLAPGPYTIRVTLTGFKPLEVKANIVQGNNRLAVGSLKLDIGEFNEAVTVSSVGQFLATTQTAHQAVLDLKQVTNLSIRGRDPISLLKILPGVSLLANDQETFGGSFATAVPAIQGSTRGQTIYVDGINGGDGGGSGGGGGNFSGATNMDAIAEVNVQMSAYAAEYGLKGGAQVNFITKHGGTEYHGTAYTYQRATRFNSTQLLQRDREPAETGIPVQHARRHPRRAGAGLNKKVLFFYSLDDTQLKDVEHPAAMDDADRPRTPRRFLADPHAGRRADRDSRSAHRREFSRQRHPVESSGSARAGAAEHAADAQRDRQLRLQLSRPGAEHRSSAPAASVPLRRAAHASPTRFRSRVRPGTPRASATTSPAPRRAGVSSGSATTSRRTRPRLDYTRILGKNTVLEVNTGVFNSHEDGPPEDDKALASIQRASFPALANLPQFAAANNPLGLIPKATWGNFQSSGSNDWIPNISTTIDGRSRATTRHSTSTSTSRTTADRTPSRSARCASARISARRDRGPSPASSTSAPTRRTRTTPDLPSPTPSSAR